eukprot:gene9510-19662_t
MFATIARKIFVPTASSVARAAVVVQSRAISSSTVDLRDTGTVKWFDPRKGFGFIQPDEEGPDLFVHWSNLQCQDDVYKTLNDDEVVEFDMDSTETASGEKYVHVAKIAGTRRGLMAPSDLIFETSLSMKSKQFSSEWIIHAQEKPRNQKWQALAVTGPNGTLLPGSPRYQNDHDGY